MRALTTDTPADLPALVIWSTTAVRILLAAFFVFVAVKNLAGDATMAADFERWGYPDGFRVFTACVQILGAAALLHPSTTFAGALVLAGVMVGAIATHWLHDPPATIVSPPVFLVLIALVSFVHRPPFLRS